MTDPVITAAVGPVVQSVNPAIAAGVGALVGKVIGDAATVLVDVAVAVFLPVALPVILLVSPYLDVTITGVVGFEVFDYLERQSGAAAGFSSSSLSPVKVSGGAAILDIGHLPFTGGASGAANERNGDGLVFSFADVSTHGAPIGGAPRAAIESIVTAARSSSGNALAILLHGGVTAPVGIGQMHHTPVG